MRNDFEEVKVKICGIQSIEVAMGAMEAGADFFGFVFVPESKRYIEPEKAGKIVREISNFPPSLKLRRTSKFSPFAKASEDKQNSKFQFVGVFENEGVEKVNEIMERVGLDFVQLHGGEDMQYVAKVKSQVIWRVREKGETISNIKYPISNIKFGHISYLLLDRVVQGRGEMVDLERAREMSKQSPLFFAGGLTPENVAGVVESVRPFGVDVSGGVETEGKKDLEKMRQFVIRAKGWN